MGHSDSLNVERVENNAFSQNNESRKEILDVTQDSIPEPTDVKISYADVVKGK